jgi:predicted Zn-dependent protease
MKPTAVIAALLLSVSPAYAQFGKLGDLAKHADQVKKITDLNINEKDERAIGEGVSAKLVDRFGIYQDAAVAKYVSLVGSVLAQASSRPNLDWKFIVLDTEGVNAYAAPGGIVHITKGALGLIKSEAELAGVLGHELTHVTAKHTVKAIQKAKVIDAGTNEISSQGGMAASLVGKFVDQSYSMVFENKLDRNDESESDRVGIALANKVGYAPKGMADFLTHVAARNKSTTEPNGLFASHPQITDRLQAIARITKEQKLTATAMVQARYAGIIKFDAKPVTEIATIEEGAKGAVGGGSTAKKDAKEDAKKEDPKKKGGFGLGKITSGLSGGKQAESTQASASAGARGGVPDRNAPGGANKTPVRVSISAADLAEFKKGIV